MHILTVGLNYRTAPVEVREKFAITEGDMKDALRELKATKSVLECVIIATCNRTELYLVVDRKQMCGNYIRSYMEQRFGVERNEFNDHLYFLEDRDAIYHLFRVTCGLDSMIIGETQILGQVRDMFLLAQQEKTTGTLFNMIFKQAVTLAKRAHSETTISQNPVSISYAAVELGKKIFGGFSGKNVLIVGAGKMSELTAKHLQGGGAASILVVNRTRKRAEELADKFGGVAIDYNNLDHALHAADIVISSTGARDYVLTKDQVKAMLPARKNRPLFLIDIAVPRDLDPAITELSGVYLYDIDDLQSIVEMNLEERQQAAAVIETMIDQEYAAYVSWYKTLGLGPVIHALQAKSNRIHEETLDSLLKKLPDLSEREVTVIRRLTKSIVNQMLRDPIVRVKEMAGERDGSEAVDMFVQLFALEDMLLKETESSSTAAVEDKEREAESNGFEQLAAAGTRGLELFAGS